MSSPRLAAARTRPSDTCAMPLTRPVTFLSPRYSTPVPLLPVGSVRPADAAKAYWSSSPSVATCALPSMRTSPMPFSVRRAPVGTPIVSTTSLDRYGVYGTPMPSWKRSKKPMAASSSPANWLSTR